MTTVSAVLARPLVPAPDPEALELRDGDASRYLGKGVLTAVGHAMVPFATVGGPRCLDQAGVDQRMIEADGTDNKAQFGANAILAVSLATAKAAALSAKPLYQHIAELSGCTLCLCLCR